jgi:mRNA interferase RelE/StbE
MTWRALYHPEVASEDLPRIPKNMQRRLKRAIESRLLLDPILAGGPLRGSLLGYRKLRVGDCRIIYRVEGSEIRILVIGHRRDVYSAAFERIIAL